MQRYSGKQRGWNISFVKTEETEELKKFFQLEI